MQIFAAQFYNGLTYAGLLFIVASGLSLTLGVMGILNLTHGAFYMLGAYIGITVAAMGGNFWLSLLAAAAIAMVTGVVIQRVFLSRLYKQDNMQVVVTLGFIYIISNIVLWVWGPITRQAMPPSILTGSIIIGEGFRLLKYRTAVIIIAVLIAIGLWLLLNKTRIGAMTRAGMDDAEMTIGLGINNALVSGGVFLLGAFLAGFAGYIGAPIWGARYMAGFEITLFCCAVVIVGGMGSVPGTLLGALLIGIIDSLGRAYFPEFARFTMYAAIILMLMIRPSGLLGRKI